MSYNFLRDAISIDNSPLCRYDTSDSYSSDFNINGDVDGWDVYYNTHLYGCWNGILFGTAFDRDPYISRSTMFSSVEAEYYYYIKIMMKVTNNNTNKIVGGLTKGRVQWTTISDDIWNSTKQTEFDIIADGKWRLYTINVGPVASWVGYINNLRIYPFIDGWSGDQYAIKFIRIGSLDYWRCSNTQCSYYSQYSHPCEGAGVRGSCEAGIARTLYTTVSGVTDELVLNIDHYGDVVFKLGNNSNVKGSVLAKLLSNKVSSLNIGGYSFSSISYTENNTIKIISGTTGEYSSVVVSGNAADTLGFYDGVNDVSVNVIGQNPATGFDYSASRLLTAGEINRLIDGDTVNPSYYHKPDQYNVEAGRGDFNEINASVLTSSVTGNTYVKSLSNKGSTLIDHSHPVNNNGRIKAIYVSGLHYGNGKIKICRPHNDGTFTVIASINLPLEDSGMYTKLHTNYRIECDVLVNKGDRIGIYGCDLHVGKTLNGYPDATYSQYQGEASGRFDAGEVYSFGVAGFAVYARGDRWQTNAILDIDLGNRTNIDEFTVYGNELASYFEYNLMSCLDVTWDVELFGETHSHLVQNILTGISTTHIHNNYAIGVECLDDMVITPDNGKAGNSLESTDGEHSYFYVTGDAEWLYGECDGKSEFCFPYSPSSTFSYKYDKVQFTALFPYGIEIGVHKCKMYFKEKNNFRSFRLSTFLGNYNATGNDPDYPNWNLIPNYTAISLDGIRYDYTNNDLLKAYLFVNPTSHRNITDIDVLKSANFTDWFIIEHEFNKVLCKGFRILCDEHYSTKIMELELYSRMDVDPSLVDNVTLSFSDYGDVWKTVNFVSEDINKITGFIGGAPRYFRLELESSTAYSLNELEMLVGDQFQFNNCSDEGVLLETSKTGVVNPPTSFSVENVYDKPFDLIVDLPRETYESNGIMFWSRLSSQEDIDTPEIGPGCILHKSDDYLIRHDNAQCAIDVPCYGLKNLINDKYLYINYYDDDWGYEFYDTMTSGESLDLDNSNRCNVKQSILEFDTPLNVYKYWKIGFDEVVGDGFILHDIVAYFNDERQLIDLVCKSGNVGVETMTKCVTSDGLNIPLDNYFTFDVEGDYEGFVIEQYNASGAFVDVTGGKLIVNDYGSHTSGGGSYYEHGACATSVLDTLQDFYCYGLINTVYTSSSQIGYMYLYLDHISYSEVISISVGDWWSGSYSMRINLDNEIGNVYQSSSVNNGSNFFTITRTGSDLTFIWNGSKVYSGTCHTKPINRVRVYFVRYRDYGPAAELSVDYMKITSVYGNNSAVSFRTSDDNALINKVKFYHSPTTSINQVSLYGSNDNVIYSLSDGDGNVTLNNSNWYQSFAIDLEKRHGLSIIRNYGNSTDKLWLSTVSNVDYSNSTTNNVLEVGWDNSDVNDVKWLRLNLLCGDGVTRCVRTLGVYPNINSAYCVGGGYNCEWEYLGNILTEYSSPINVAYNSEVDTNYYFSNSYPTYAVEGVTDTYSLDHAWAFQEVDGVDPYLVIDFGDLYTINRIVLYHGLGEAVVTTTKSFTIEISTTVSGDFTIVKSVTGNTEDFNDYIITPVQARRLKFTVTDYSGERLYVDNYETGERDYFWGAYLREIEVYTYVESGYVNSEDWPVVCVNLQDQFTVLNHSLENKNPQDNETDWSNDEEFFRYSDNVFSDPHKVCFSDSSTNITVYYTDDSSGDRAGYIDYEFTTSVYIEASVYNITYQAYDVDSLDEMSLRLEGVEVIDIYPSTTANGAWQTVHALINIKNSGFYTIKGIQHLDQTNNWGIRYPHIYRTYGYVKWVAVTRDTATNYAFDDSSDNYGKDYLSTIKVYGDTKYAPTEYFWWWNSTVSILSNDYLKVKTLSRSLKISYPDSSDIDIITNKEGDDFGYDKYWSVKDALSFWLWIDDISKLDTTFGDITFGNLNDVNPIYYVWNISSVSLNTGWNKIQLKFEDCDYAYPLVDDYHAVYFYDRSLDYRLNERCFKSFKFRYRGIGEAFTIYLTDINIERNKFFDQVKFDKGLCLTGHDYLEIPLEGVTLERGSIEFWFKPYYDSYGRDIFDNWYSRSLFSLVNNNNNIISLNIRSGAWFEIACGHLRRNLNLYNETSSYTMLHNFIDINSLVHVAMVWSNDGNFTSNGDTLRFYINGVLFYTSRAPWVVDDTKYLFIKLAGGATQLAANQDFWGGGVFSDLKIYDYCKNSFNINEDGVSKDISYEPNKFLEISKDNMNFYNIDSSMIPFIFEQVPPGDSRTIYLRSVKNEYFKQSKKSANLLVSWLTTV